MYEEYFSFSGNPFKINPDPRFFYGSASHNKAMSYLHYGLRQAEGFIVITGEIGAGKSMIIGHLLDQLDRSRVTAAHLIRPNLRPEDLLAHILSAFHIEAANEGKAAELEAFEDYLFDQMSHGRRVLLIVDEAQSLPAETLEELRILSNMDYSGTPLFQIFLLAQPEFRDTVARDDMDQLRQRIIASYHLEAMDLEETKDYIEHRLKVVGWRDNPKFAEGSFHAIYDETNGLPRKINKLCNRILLFCSVEDVAVIGPEAIKAVIDDMREEGVDPSFVDGRPKLLADGADTDHDAIMLEGAPLENKDDAIALQTLSVDDEQNQEAENAVGGESDTHIIDIEAEASNDGDVEQSKIQEDSINAGLDALAGELNAALDENDGQEASDEAALHVDEPVAEEPSVEDIKDESALAGEDNDVEDVTDADDNDDSQMSVLDRLRAKRETAPLSDESKADADKEGDQAISEEGASPESASIDDVAKAIEDAASRAASDQAFDEASDAEVLKQTAISDDEAAASPVRALYETPAMNKDMDGWRRAMLRSIKETQQDLKAAHHQVVGVQKEISDSNRLYKDKRREVLKSLSQAEQLLDELRAVWR